MIYPLASSSWGKEEIQAIQNVIDSDMYTMGKHVKQFEQEFAEYMGVKHCITVSSGTSALVLLLRACNLPQGSKVLVPAFTPIPTSMAIFEAGLIPEFVGRFSMITNIDSLTEQELVKILTEPP